MINDASDGQLNLIQEILAETEFSLIVKISRRIKLALCLRMKRETHFL